MIFALTAPGKPKTLVPLAGREVDVYCDDLVTILLIAKELDDSLTRMIVCLDGRAQPKLVGENWTWAIGVADALAFITLPQLPTY